MLHSDRFNAHCTAHPCVPVAALRAKRFFEHRLATPCHPQPAICQDKFAETIPSLHPPQRYGSAKSTGPHLSFPTTTFPPTLGNPTLLSTIARPLRTLQLRTPTPHKSNTTRPRPPIQFNTPCRLIHHRLHNILPAVRRTTALRVPVQLPQHRDVLPVQPADEHQASTALGVAVPGVVDGDAEGLAVLRAGGVGAEGYAGGVGSGDVLGVAQARKYREGEVSGAKKWKMYGGAMRGGMTVPCNECVADCSEYDQHPILGTRSGHRYTYCPTTTTFVGSESAKEQRLLAPGVDSLYNHQTNNRPAGCSSLPSRVCSIYSPHGIISRLHSPQGPCQAIRQPTLVFHGLDMNIDLPCVPFAIRVALLTCARGCSLTLRG